MTEYVLFYFRRACGTLICLVLACMSGVIVAAADDSHVEHAAAAADASQPPAAIRPFPKNRVRDFYADQARRLLRQTGPRPELLPAFPGLDGGSFGHWGQNPEADNYDATLNDVQIGGLLSQVTRHFGQTTFKAINFRFGATGEYSALFDPEALRYADIWRDGFVRWQSSRFGITSGVEAVGTRTAPWHDAGWTLPAGTKTRYAGLFRNGREIVFHYHIGTASIYDRLLANEGSIRRELTIEGDLPPGVQVSQGLPTKVDDGATKQFAQGASPQWQSQTVDTVGQLGAEAGPYAIDTLAIPYGSQNPFGTPMRIGGFDFLPDGRIAVSTLIGDVWLVEGVDETLERLRWKRIAAGLNQPLGLVVQHGKILVIGRDQLTRLHDLNGDDEADYYECVTHKFPTAGGDSFATALDQDEQGNLYWFTYAHNFGVTRFGPSGASPPVSIATGLRGTNGMGVSPDGRIVLATAQEGTWTPASTIFEVGDGSYHGFMGPRKDIQPYGYDLPLCFIPRGIDNSCGGLAFLPNDPRIGPLAGQIIGTSYGYCQHYLVLREQVGDRVQGGVVPLPGEFLAGAHRARFNPRDGHLYVAGTDGWQSYAKANGSLQRIRYCGGQLPLPVHIETRSNGLLIRFNTEVDPRSLDNPQVLCEQWNYLYSAGYGSPEFSVKQPGRRGHDSVAVKSLHLLSDQKSVFLEIPQLHPVMQFHVYLQLAASSGQAFAADIYYSIFQLGVEFTDFPGYEPIAKSRRPAFPTATDYPRDARLIAQDALGKEFSTLQGVVSRQINAVAGLRYEPQVLRVPPGKRVALVVKNTDPSMPHNWVLVQPDRFETVGESAMLLAADPRAIANHYVPHDQGVLAFSPILNPNDQYTVYFDSPTAKGAYPFLCSFPGHWQVMRGVMHVLDEEDPLPTTSSFGPTREFVRMWTLDELADEANALLGRSFEQGQRTFQTAGCGQCHKVAGQGADLGPDLTNIHERFQGAKLLQQILEPSSEINKQYQTFVVYRQDGTSITGLMVQETERTLTLMNNPLQPDQLTQITRDDIDEMEPSNLSTMPKGLLMTLRRDEILDLLAYLTARGDRQHAVFQKP